MVCGSSIIVKNKILDDLLGPTIIASTVDESMTIVNAKSSTFLNIFLCSKCSYLRRPEIFALCIIGTDYVTKLLR